MRDRPPLYGQILHLMGKSQDLITRLEAVQTFKDIIDDINFQAWVR